MSLKDLFITPDPPEPAKPAREPVAGKAPTEAVSRRSIVSEGVASAPVTSHRDSFEDPLAGNFNVDRAMVAKFVDRLRQKMGAPPVAMTRFQEAMVNLREFIPDQDVCVRAALKQSGDPTGQGVLAAVEQQRNMLGSEDALFQKTVEADKESRLSGRRKEIDSLDAEIAQLNIKREGLQRQITEAGASIDTATASFASALEVVRRELTDIRNLVASKGVSK